MTLLDYLLISITAWCFSINFLTTFIVIYISIKEPQTSIIPTRKFYRNWCIGLLALGLLLWRKKYE